MPAKTFPGYQIGMDNPSDNRESFDAYVAAYFPDVTDISAISLLYKVDCTATVIAVTSHGDQQKDMPIDKDDVRQMLSSLAHELDVMGVRLKSINIDIQKAGTVMVNVNW